MKPLETTLACFVAAVGVFSIGFVILTGLCAVVPSEISPLPVGPLSASVEPVVWETGPGTLPPLQVFQVGPIGDPEGERQRPAFVKVGTEFKDISDFQFIDHVGAVDLFPEVRLRQFPSTVVYFEDELVEVREGVQSEEDLRAIVAKWRVKP